MNGEVFETLYNIFTRIILPSVDLKIIVLLNISTESRLTFFADSIIIKLKKKIRSNSYV